MIAPVWLNLDGSEHARLNALSCSLDLSINDMPKATLTVPAADAVPNTHDFLRIATEFGQTEIYRVVSSTFKYGQTCQLQLIGAVDTLSDDIWAESLEEQTMTAAEWIRNALGRQTVTRWQLGQCALTANVKMRINYGELWSILEEVRNARPGFRWVYDYSTHPWTLSLVQMPNTVASEFRVTRNIESAQITVSDQNMVNRLIFTVTDGNNGNPSVNVYNDTQSQNRYGVRTRCTDIKTDEIPLGMTAEEYAHQLLAEHAVPDYSISINGVDLSRLTGTALDHLQLGYMCRAVLPEYGETVTERLVSLSYADILNEPMRVRVQLSTELGSITGSIASAKRVAQAVKSSRGGGSAKADKDSWAKVLTDVIQATDGTGIQELWQSGIQMTSHGGVRLFSLYQGLSSLDSELNITNTSITSEVSRASAEEGRLSSRIEQTAEAITLKVSKGDVATQLSVECGNVTISGTPGSGGNLVVSGYATVNQLNAQSARIDNLLNGTTVADTLKATNCNLGSNGSGSVNIYGQRVRVYAVTDNNGTTRQVFGYTL